MLYVIQHVPDNAFQTICHTVYVTPYNIDRHFTWKPARKETRGLINYSVDDHPEGDRFIEKDDLARLREDATEIKGRSTEGDDQGIWDASHPLPQQPVASQPSIKTFAQPVPGSEVTAGVIANNYFPEDESNVFLSPIQPIAAVPAMVETPGILLVKKVDIDESDRSGLQTLSKPQPIPVITDRLPAKPSMDKSDTIVVKRKTVKPMVVTKTPVLLISQGSNGALIAGEPIPSEHGVIIDPGHDHDGIQANTFVNDEEGETPVITH
jgi:hypothetical protein